MTAIESLPAYREAEVAAKRRGENLGSLIDAFLAGYARGDARTNGLVADVQPTSLMTAPLPGDSPCKLFLSFLVSPSPCTQSPACRSRTARLDEFAQMDNDRYVCVLRGLRLFLDYKV